jgi:hypothetical protein
MATTYTDGNYSTAFLVGNVVTYPFAWPNNSNVAQFDLTFVQWANTYSEPALDSTSAYAPSAYLVEKGPVEKIAPGHIRYRQTFCQLPVAWTETQQTAYSFPGLSGGIPWNPYFYRNPITLYAIATVDHTYTHGATPPTLDNTFIVTDDDNVVDYIGTSNPNFGSVLTDPSIEPSEYVVSSESRLLKGLIWEKVSMNVPKPV